MSTTSPPVVVTGIGVVSALGRTSEEHFLRLLGGECGASSLAQGPSRSVLPQAAARVPHEALRRAVGQRMLRKVLPPSALSAVVAAREALHRARLEETQHRDRCGIYLGSTSFELRPEVFRDAVRGCTDPEGGVSAERLARRGARQLDPLLIVKSLPNAALSGIAIEHSLHGPALNLANGSSSGLQAVAAACGAILRGEASVAVTGGADSLIIEYLGIERVHDLRRQRCTAEGSAADRSDSGLLPGEGAAIAVVESATHAAARGAQPLAEIVAFAERSATRGDGCESHSDVVASAIRECLARGCVLRPDAVFADGTADPELDRAEVMALAAECGPIPVTSAAGAIGETGAASGAFSLCHAIESLRRGCLPPTIGHRFHTSRDVDVVRRARLGDYRNVLVINGDLVKSTAVLVRSPTRSRAPSADGSD